MILQSLQMERVRYGDRKGEMAGKARFEGSQGAVEILLDQEKCNTILTICAMQIVDTAKLVARDLTAQEILGRAAIASDS